MDTFFTSISRRPTIIYQPSPVIQAFTLAEDKSFDKIDKYVKIKQQWFSSKKRLEHKIIKLNEKYEPI